MSNCLRRRLIYHSDTSAKPGQASVKPGNLTQEFNLSPDCSVSPLVAPVRPQLCSGVEMLPPLIPVLASGRSIHFKHQIVMEKM